MKLFAFLVALLIPVTASAAPMPYDQMHLSKELSAIVGIDTYCWPGELNGPSGYYNPALLEFNVKPSITLSYNEVCRPLRGSIHRWNRGRTRATVAWKLFAHEYAHHLGYDHGETTIGADCAGYYQLPHLICKAGLSEDLRRTIQRRIARWGPCD